MQGCSFPAMLWVLRSPFLKPGLILFTIQMRFQAYLPKSTTFSALLPVLLWLALEHLAKASFQSMIVGLCKWIHKLMQIRGERKSPSCGLGQCSRTFKGSAEQTLGALPTLMWNARKSDVNMSSQGFYSEFALSCQFFWALAWNSLPVLVCTVLCSRLRLKWIVQDGQEYDQE